MGGWSASTSPPSTPTSPGGTGTGPASPTGSTCGSGRPRRGLRELPEQPHLDLAFIDADKAGYPDYWAQLVPRVRPGGLLAVDNVLWSGRVADPAPGDESARMMARFNQIVANDDRVDVVILPVGDGLTLARRR